MMASRMDLMNMQQQQQHMQGGGPMAPGSPHQMMRGQMIRGPGPGMGGPRMQQYPRGMMMQDGSPGMQEPLPKGLETSVLLLGKSIFVFEQ